MTVMWYQLASVGCAVQLLLPLAYAELVHTVTENAAQFGGGMVAMEDHLRDKTSTATKWRARCSDVSGTEHGTRIERLWSHFSP